MITKQISVCEFDCNENRDRSRCGRDHFIHMKDIPTLLEKIKSLEAKKRAVQEKYDLIIQTTIDAIIMITEEGKISLWNPAAEKIFGYKREEVIGKDLHLLLTPAKYHEDYKIGFEQFKKRGKGPLTGKLLELTAVKKDGTHFPVGLSLSVAKVGTSWISVGIVRDITRRKKNEKALQDSRNNLEKIVEQRTVELKQANVELKRNSKQIGEANIALRILLQKASEAEKKLEEKILNNINELVAPYIDELLLKLRDRDNILLLHIIKDNLDKITSAFAQTLLLKYKSLTPREIQVADLIRHGRTTKEIAHLLNVSTCTVETYRANLRDKFRLRKKKANLRSFLKSLVTD